MFNATFSSLRSSAAAATPLMRDGAQAGVTALAGLAVLWGGAAILAGTGYGLFRGGQALLNHLRSHRLGSLTFLASHTTSGEAASHSITIILDHPETDAAPATTTAEAATSGPTEPAGAPAPA